MVKTPRTSESVVVAALTVFVALAAACLLLFLVPPGEAPDEPAHLEYVDHVARFGELPAVLSAPVGRTYEFHQPPLAYVSMAAAVRWAGFGGIAYPFVSNPSFAFQSGMRAFIEPEPTAIATRAAQSIRLARAVNLLWLALAETAILFVCFRICRSLICGAAAALPFCLNPQLLFTCATANNDAALIGLSSLVVAGLVILLDEGCEAGATAVLVSTLAGLALWSKATALFLIPGVVVVLTPLMRQRQWRRVIALLVPGIILALGWLALVHYRCDSVLPLPADMPGNDPGGWFRLIAQPAWLLSVGTSFWAKFGWFNLPLPVWAYLAFVLPSAAAVLGLFLPRRRGGASDRSARLLFAVLIASNLALLVLFMVRVDWQPQGRYLLPSIVPLAGLCAMALSSLWRRVGPGTARCILAVSAVSALSGVAVAVTVIAGAY